MTSARTAPAALPARAGSVRPLPVPRPRPFVLLAIAVAAVLASLPREVRADAAADAAAFAGRVLAPLAPGDPVSDAWTWKETLPDPRGVRVRLAPSGGGDPLDVLLAPRDDARPRVASTPSLDLLYISGSDGDAKGAAGRSAVFAVAARVVPNDPGSLDVPRLTPVVPVADGPVREGPIDAFLRAARALLSPAGLPTLNRTVLQALFLFLLVATGLVLRSAAAAAPPTRVQAAAFLGLVLLAFGLRFLLSPHAFLHEYYHHAQWLPWALWDAGFQPLYGDTGPALFRIAEALASGAERGVFATNAILASLAVPAVVLLDLALSGSWPRALFAGLVLCVMPQNLRYSASEDAVVPTLLFTVWSLALGLRYVDTRGRLCLAALVAALALAMQSRAEVLAFPAVLAAFVVGVRGREALRALVAPRALVAWFVLGVLVLPRLGHFLFDPSGGRAVGASPVELVETLLEGTLPPHSVLDASVSSPVLWVLVAAGAAWMAWQCPRVLVAIVFAAEGYIVLTSTMFANPDFIARTQVVVTPFWALLAAGAVPAALRWLPRRVALAVLPALAVGGTIPYVGYIASPNEAHEEWRFLVDAVPGLPDGPGTLLTQDAHRAFSTSPFPSFLLARAGKSLAVKDFRGGNLPAPEPGLLFYQGMYCYMGATVDDVPEPMSRDCREVLDRYVLAPLVTRSITGVPSCNRTYTGGGGGPFEIGFYRVVGVRSDVQGGTP